MGSGMERGAMPDPHFVDSPSQGSKGGLWLMWLKCRKPCFYSHKQYKGCLNELFDLFLNTCYHIVPTELSTLSLCHSLSFYLTRFSPPLGPYPPAELQKHNTTPATHIKNKEEKKNCFPCFPQISLYVLCIFIFKYIFNNCTNRMGLLYC